MKFCLCWKKDHVMSSISISVIKLKSFQKNAAGVLKIVEFTFTIFCGRERLVTSVERAGHRPAPPSSPASAATIFSHAGQLQRKLFNVLRTVELNYDSREQLYLNFNGMCSSN